MNKPLTELAYRMVWDHSQEPPRMRLPAGVDDALRADAKRLGDEFVRFARDRYGKLPPANAIPKIDLVRHADVAPDVRRRLIEYVSNQGEQASEWVMARAAERFVGIPGDPMDASDPFDCMLTAVHELIAWQHAHRPDPIGFVVGLGKVPTMNTNDKVNA